MEQPVFKRVLLKISGEALAGDKHFGLDFQVMGRVAVSSSAAAISGAA